MNGRQALVEAAGIALRCLDLTSLNEQDGAADIDRLCARARGRCGDVAAVCVWPRLAAHARRQLPAAIGVAAVANFPAGDSGVAAVLQEVQAIAAAGAQEVDVVLPWRALLAGDDAAAVGLLQAVRAASAGLTLKVILETGALQAPERIEHASRLALDAGADFLKTSTGKLPVGATLPAAEAMLRAMRGHAQAGLKLSGGLRRVAELLPYLQQVVRERGAQALQPRHFRIGASSLLDDIEALLGGSTNTAPAGDY
ncbi:MAG TPA: deoxyribose-phosphate aldolase [Rubrivivax sp.]|mgnify:CR=1 FL=1|nr:deoxyribose-phosphate aldolase [Rubrivivax sp.]